MPGSSVLHCLLEFMSTESVMLSNHLILCQPLLLLPLIFPSIRVFSNELALHVRWPKYWSFSFSSSNEYSGLISFRTDWFDLLAVQGTLNSLLQHHSSKTSVKVANKNLLEAAEREGLWAPLQSARCLGEARKSHLAAPILGEVPVQFQVGDGLVEIHPAPL